MTIEEMNEYLIKNGLKVCNDNIIRDRFGKPKCPNPIFQPLLEELQDNGKLDYRKETLYGQCFMSLIEIVLNNKHFKFQTTDIKEECRLEALLVLEALPKYFDRNKGSTVYSYAFRCMYTNMIHVLERHNEEKEMMEKLYAALQEELALENSARKVVTNNQ